MTKRTFPLLLLSILLLLTGCTAKPAATVLTGHPGKFPHIAAADGTACTEQDESQAGPQTFAIFHNFIFLSYSISE